MPGIKRKRTSQTQSQTLSQMSQGRRRRNSRVRVPRDKLAFPQQLKTKLRYCVRRECKLTSADAVVTTIRANDLYDPEFAIGGHQPRGFDEMMKVYKTFTVIGSSCSGSFVYEGYMGPSEVENSRLVQTVGASVTAPPNTRTPALPPVVVGIHKGMEQLSTGPAAEQMEKDRTKWTYLTPNMGAAQVRTTLKCSDFFGKKSLVGAEGYSGTDAGSPTEEILYEVWAARLDDNTGLSGATVNVPVYIVVEYDCVFTDPKTLDAS